MSSGSLTLPGNDLHQMVVLRLVLRSTFGAPSHLLVGPSTEAPPFRVDEAMHRLLFVLGATVFLFGLFTLWLAYALGIVPPPDRHRRHCPRV